MFVQLVNQSLTDLKKKKKIIQKSYLCVQGIDSYSYLNPRKRYFVIIFLSSSHQTASNIIWQLTVTLHTEGDSDRRKNATSDFFREKVCTVKAKCLVQALMVSLGKIIADSDKFCSCDLLKRYFNHFFMRAHDRSRGVNHFFCIPPQE